MIRDNKPAGPSTYSYCMEGDGSGWRYQGHLTLAVLTNRYLLAQATDRVQRIVPLMLDKRTGRYQPREDLVQVIEAGNLNSHERDPLMIVRERGQFGWTLFDGTHFVVTMVSTRGLDSYLMTLLRHRPRLVMTVDEESLSNRTQPLFSTA